MNVPIVFHTDFMNLEAGSLDDTKNKRLDCLTLLAQSKPKPRPTSNFRIIGSSLHFIAEVNRNNNNKRQHYYQSTEMSMVR
jgi:hypothetical protein